MSTSLRTNSNTKKSNQYEVLNRSESYTTKEKQSSNNSSSSSIENISYISKKNESYSDAGSNELRKTDSDYDYCKEFKPTESRVKQQNDNRFAREPLQTTSPMKRSNNNQQQSSNKNDHDNVQSPKKRLRMPPNFAGMQSQRISTSLCLENKEAKKKSIASTPKSERRLNPVSRLKQLKDSEEVQRNLSSSWADIIEELETQQKELNEYADKVVDKYKIDKEKLLKILEQDSEVLRKRQKKINYGKLTPEYQRYIAEVKKRTREPFHPRTPNKFNKCSRRKFDGLVKKWRRMLHVWDENPDQLKDFKHSLDEQDDEYTEDFGGTSQIESASSIYNVDDYDIIDYESDDKAAEN